MLRLALLADDECYQKHRKPAIRSYQRRAPSWGPFLLMEHEMTNSSTALAAPHKPDASIIIFGRDEVDKPHAAAFAANDAVLATKAAELTGMRVIQVEGGELAALAQQLAAGKVFASGKAFVPFVGAALYDQVLTTAGIVEPDWDARAATRAANVRPKPSAKVIHLGEAASGDKPAPLGAAPGAGNKRPTVATSWDGIVAGCLVLAPEEGENGGWWEAVVQEQRGEHMFVLCWQNWPDETIVRRRDNLALLPTGRVKF